MLRVTENYSCAILGYAGMIRTHQSHLLTYSLTHFVVYPKSIVTLVRLYTAALPLEARAGPMGARFERMYDD